MKIHDKKQRDLNSIQTYSNVSPNIYSVPDDEEVTPERPVTTAIIICVASYTIVPTYGYLTFGNKVNEDILLSYDSNLSITSF